MRREGGEVRRLGGGPEAIREMGIKRAGASPRLFLYLLYDGLPGLFRAIKIMGDQGAERPWRRWVLLQGNFLAFFRRYEPLFPGCEFPGVGGEFERRTGDVNW